MSSEAFDKLRDFILNGMRMSHIYQPVMLNTLLLNKGRASTTKIASEISAHDPTQIEYYSKIVPTMPGKVLRNHGVVGKQARDEYFLEGFDALSDKEIATLVTDCDSQLEKYLKARGKRAFAHRKIAGSYIPGSMKYEVLKKARRRCELCGVSADIKALEVDHIQPRNMGGSNEMSNLQALCYSCNAMKRDRDNTDFRGWSMSYDDRSAECLFCNIDKSRIQEETELAFLIDDAFPVSPGHKLVIPKRHAKSYFELGRPEINACNQLLESARSHLLNVDASVQSFNIGINDGAAAGQTIPHCHIHLIPRRDTDMDDPRGGVRGVIPSMQKY